MLDNDKTCQTLCTQSNVTGEEAKFINDRIQVDYALNWLVDGLPAAEMKFDVRNHEVFYDIGFNLGSKKTGSQDRPALNNHYDIVLKYTLGLM